MYNSYYTKYISIVGVKMFENFYRELQTSVNEKDVENTYRKYISNYYNEPISSPYGSDGLLQTKLKFNEISKQLFLIMEFKDDKNIKFRTEMMKVIIQVLYYIKKFEEDGKILPNVILVADKNEAFVLHSNNVIDFLNENIDWSLPPSEAGNNNPVLLKKLIESPFYPFVFDINEKFNLDDLFNKIRDIIAENNRQIRITENNISKIYEYFIVNVVKDYKKYDTNSLVYSFIEMMKDQDLVYKRKTSSLLLSNNEEINVDRNTYRSFISHFLRSYTPEEERKFTEISDRLIEETNRRKKGEYYTPTAFVDYSQKLLDECLGAMWKREFTVWDSAWGTGNLTRDQNFKNLFVSTINKSDLDMGNVYNQGSTKFQYDFLNDDVDEIHRITSPKMPQSLRDNLENPNEKILFYINPPYATGGNANSQTTESKLDLAKSVIAELMREEKLKVSEQLYAQFLFRIIQIKLQTDSENIYIGIFSPTLFLTGTKYKKFRKIFLKHFEFVKGSMFRASHFADVKDTWAISFTIWKSKKSQHNKIQTDFQLTILDRDETGNVIEIGNKTLWNLDNDSSLQEWISSKKNSINTDKTELIPNFTSAFKYKEQLVDTYSDSICVLINDTNNIEATTKGVYFMQSPVTRNLKKIYVTHSNFEEASVTFTSRKLYKPNWINQKNEFSAPNENDPLYKEYCANCVVYSIFSNSNNVISYRNIEIDGKKFSKRNEWFFMSNKEIRDLAGKCNSEAFHDSYSFGGDSLIYDYLTENKHLLLESAKKLIVKATNIIRETFPLRENFNFDYPEFHINTWDASWQQVKKLKAISHQQAFEEFKVLFGEFENEVLGLSEQLEVQKFDE
ncbi:hypothetical protein LNK15_10365 [Jeotgalicoccus huakuii]|nr:hypothetical protein [Jeotgalicoccus huakuii]